MLFHIDSMTCGGCARGVAEAVRSVDPAATVLADPPSRTVAIGSHRSPEAFLSALARAGFPAVVAAEGQG